MRIVAEPLWTSTQILIRFLGPGVQIGNYIVDARPQIGEPVSFTLVPEMIRNQEAHIFFTGFFPFPEYLIVTLPDLTSSEVQVIEVIPPKENSTIPQDLETITPDEPEMHYPAHAEFQVEMEKEPEFPPMWVELDFARTQPVMPGPGGSFAAITYAGGAQGRALSGMQRQRDTDAAPWLDSEITRLEGSFTNLLPNASFQPTALVPGLLDPIPVGWEMELEDPLALLRVSADAGGIGLPNLTLRYRPREDDNSLITVPAVILHSPPVPAGATFQILVVPGTENRVGSVQLVTEDDLFSSPVVSFTNGQSALLRLTTPTLQPVKILWTQPKTDNSEQAIRLYTPLASNYGGPHSWAPSGTAVAADTVSVTGLGRSANGWYFRRGTVRVASSVEGIGQPLNWEIRSEVTGQLVLGLNAGILSSDFAASGTLDLGALLGATAGEYQLIWTSPVDFSLVQGTSSTVLPFTILPNVPEDVRMGTLSLTFSAFSPTLGTAIINYWSYSP